MAAVATTPTEDILLLIWRDLFHNPAITTEDDFFVLGGYSLLATSLMAAIQTVLDVQVPLHQIIETPTIAELAAYIDQQIEEQEDKGDHSALVPLQGQGNRPPFFGIHMAAGTVFVYRPLALRLGSDQPSYGVQGHGLHSDETPYDSIPDMAAHCIREMRKIQPHGPYRLGGLSFGGIVALEIAQQLHEAGEEVALLAMFDVLMPVDPWAPTLTLAMQSYREGFVRRMRRGAFHRQEIARRPTREKLAYVTNLSKRALGRVAKIQPAEQPTDAQQQPQEELPLFKQVEKVSISASRTHRPKPYAGRIVYFEAIDNIDKPALDQRQVWAKIAVGGLDYHRVPGNHNTMLMEPNVQQVAEIMRQYLDQLATIEVSAQLTAV